nr:MAG TPA: hypothetical protein [Caudoviricetes sp.]
MVSIRYVPCLLIPASLEVMQEVMEQPLMAISNTGMALLTEARLRLLPSLVTAQDMPAAEEVAVESIMIPDLKLIDTGKAVPVVAEAAEQEAVGP